MSRKLLIYLADNMVLGIMLQQFFSVVCEFITLMFSLKIILSFININTYSVQEMDGESLSVALNPEPVFWVSWLQNESSWNSKYLNVYKVLCSLLLTLVI
jgi:Zn-dependent protease with chaperone function